MSELPKSIVLEGRRYPTWALSLRAREQLVQLRRVDEHIAELRQRVAFYTSAREVCQQRLREALPETRKVSPPPRYYWQMASVEWARENWPVRSPTLDLHHLGSASHYREGDRVLVYVKGHGVVGWGCVEMDTYSTQRHITWRYTVAGLNDALPAKALKDFSVRHPNRASQALPPTADVVQLLQALESRPSG